MRPTIRLAAMMNLPVVYIFTHDSIYVGEDGPTHQPIEQLESLRVIPNLKVIRPADSEEVKAAWQVILERKEGPTALILSRQNLPRLKQMLDISVFKKGGYIVYDSNNKPDVVISASGSEVQTALQVKEILEKIIFSAVLYPFRIGKHLPNRIKLSGKSSWWCEYTSSLH